MPPPSLPLRRHLRTASHQPTPPNAAPKRTTGPHPRHMLHANHQQVHMHRPAAARIIQTLGSTVWLYGQCQPAQRECVLLCAVATMCRGVCACAAACAVCTCRLQPVLALVVLIINIPPMRMCTPPRQRDIHTCSCCCKPAALHVMRIRRHHCRPCCRTSDEHGMQCTVRIFNAHRHTAHSAAEGSSCS
jgi:hypothetical protein